MNFTIDDRSIVIIWIDESITSVERFLVENLKPALTRARKAIYFIGNIEFLRVRIFARFYISALNWINFHVFTHFPFFNRTIHSG